MSDTNIPEHRARLERFAAKLGEWIEELDDSAKQHGPEAGRIEAEMRDRFAECQAHMRRWLDASGG